MKIQFLGHTADIRMKIEADDLSAFFRAGMRGMAQILGGDFCRKNYAPEITRELDIKAPDTTCLLIDFLSEVLSMSYTEKSIFCELQIRNLDATHLTAQISGSSNTRWEEEIKAVTYHEAEVRKNTSGRWETHLVFDI